MSVDIDPSRRWMLVLWALPLAVPFVLQGYLLGIATLAVIVAVLVVSLDILYGYTGQLSLAHAGFYGIGAYLSAILVMDYNVPIVAGILLATIGVGVFSVVVGFPLLRTTGLTFSIITLALSVVIFEILNNWSNVTNGAIGLRNIPTLMEGNIAYLVFYVFLIGVLVFKRALVASPIGKSFIAIREDEELAAEMGIRTHRYKTLSFVLSSIIAGLTGAMYAHYAGFLSPGLFTMFRSFELFIIVVVGGAGTLAGPVVGAVVLTWLPELLREVQDFRQIAYSLLLIVIIMYFPDGIVGTVDAGAWRRQVRGVLATIRAQGLDDGAVDAPLREGDD